MYFVVWISSGLVIIRISKVRYSSNIICETFIIVNVLCGVGSVDISVSRVLLKPTFREVNKVTSVVITTYLINTFNQKRLKYASNINFYHLSSK